MKIKEIELQSKALWESAKTDLKFFAPIQVFIKKLSETDFSNPENLGDIKLYIEKIEEFFNRYRPTPGGGLYIPLIRPLEMIQLLKQFIILSNNLVLYQRNN